MKNNTIDPSQFFQDNGHKIQFSDHVRIKDNPVTTKLKINGKTGTVFGDSKPSVSKVEVIGNLEEDYAIYVSLTDSKDSYWMPEDYAEVLDHGVGTQAKIGDIKLEKTKKHKWKLFR